MTHHHTPRDLATLVIEPSAMQSKHLIAELAKTGIARVEAVHSSDDALSRLWRGGISLVDSAFHLPDMTGAELIGA